MKLFILSCLLAAVLGVDNTKTRKLFNDLDKNGDGDVQLEELLNRFGEIDTNNDGNVTIEECIASKPHDMSLPKIQSYFNFMDSLETATDGFISVSFIIRIFITLDVNNDGEVSFKEYKKSHFQLLDDIKQEIEALLC